MRQLNQGLISDALSKSFTLIGHLAIFPAKDYSVHLITVVELFCWPLKLFLANHESD